METDSFFRQVADLEGEQEKSCMQVDRLKNFKGTRWRLRKRRRKKHRRVKSTAGIRTRDPKKRGGDWKIINLLIILSTLLHYSITCAFSLHENCKLLPFEHSVCNLLQNI